MHSFSIIDISLSFSSMEVINSFASLASVSAISASSFQLSFSFATISRSPSTSTRRLWSSLNSYCISAFDSCWFVSLYMASTLAPVAFVDKVSTISLRSSRSSDIAQSCASTSSIRNLSSLHSSIACCNCFSVCSRLLPTPAKFISAIFTFSCNLWRSWINSCISLSKSPLCSRNSSASARKSKYASCSLPRATLLSDIPESFFSATSCHSSLWRHVPFSSDSRSLIMHFRLCTSAWIST